MKFDGQTLRSTPTHTFTLPRADGPPLVLTLRPLPLSFHRRLRKQGLNRPTPPSKVARDSSGKIIRDGQGQIITHHDESCPEYLSALEAYHQRVAVLSIAEALRDDPHLTFDTPRPTGDNGWSEYADALFSEMEMAGWTTGDLIRICQEICRLSNLLDSRLEEEEANFSCRDQNDFP